jgi:thiamine-monophosphate kinase
MKKKSEDHHISKWLKAWPQGQALPLGPGDDCAVLPSPSPQEQLVWKTDAVVQDVHFRISDSARAIGHKALARVLSDFAAMGAVPQFALITVGLPSSLPSSFVQRCYQGMGALAQKWNISLAGGETTRSQTFWLSVSGLGQVKKNKAITRAGAKPGDYLFITGKLGGSFPQRHLRFTPRLAEGQWLAQKNFATAMMDVSDGLGKDLPRLAAASEVSYQLQASALPRNKGCTADQALNDGEDYELLFTVHPQNYARLIKSWPFSTKLSCFGLTASPQKANVTDGLNFQGYDHFNHGQ